MIWLFILLYIVPVIISVWICVKDIKATVNDVTVKDLTQGILVVLTPLLNLVFLLYVAGVSIPWDKVLIKGRTK